MDKFYVVRNEVTNPHANRDWAPPGTKTNSFVTLEDATTAAAHWLSNYPASKYIIYEVCAVLRAETATPPIRFTDLQTGEVTAK